MENDGEYTIAFWAKVDGSEGQSRPIWLSVQTTLEFFDEEITLDSTDWKEYIVTFPTNGWTGNARISLGISQTPTDFWLDDFRFFEDTPPDVFTRGDVNADGNLSSPDAVLVLQHIVGIVTLTDAQIQAADMSNDGEISANDAILILRKIVGLAAPDGSPQVGSGGQITVALAEPHGTAAGSVTVPLVVHNIGVVAGGDIQITYDSTAFRAVRVSPDPAIFLASNITEPGTVRISFVSAERLNSETLAGIQFDILGDGDSMPAIRNADLYDPEAIPLISGGMGREIIPLAIPPERSVLLQNFPNPFNPDTWIPYQLRADSEVTIRIFSLQGDMVRELDLGAKSGGLYVNRDRAARWDGRNDAGETVASGIYFYSISAGDFAAVRKLTVVR